MRIDLSGRRALITGGSRGLGLAMAQRFAAAGARVAIVARDVGKLAEARAAIRDACGADVETLSCDVADAAALPTAWERTQAALGGVDILVNNAGTSKRGPFESIDDAAWYADLELKLFAAIRLARFALPAMRERRWGRVINVVNVGAKAPGAETAPTTVSRAAGIALTKVLAREYAPHNVLVNALCVGMIDSDQWRDIARRDLPSGSFEDYVAQRVKGIPLGRIGRGEEFANLACFLASDAGSYITGTAINVDGGLSPVV